MKLPIRPVLAVFAAVAVVAGGAVASAAPAKPSCNLIEDAKADTFLIRSQDSAGAYGPNESAVDIVSGDIATDGKTITAVLRIAKLAKSSGTAPTGLSFRVQFASPSQDDENMYLSAATNGTTETFAAGTRAITANLATKLADATGVFDLAKSEVRISVPLKIFAAQGLKPGTKLSMAGLDQTANRLLPNGSGVFADVATSEKTYIAGAKSCVVPGK